MPRMGFLSAFSASLEQKLRDRLIMVLSRRGFMRRRRQIREGQGARLKEIKKYVDKFNSLTKYYRENLEEPEPE